MIQDIKDLTKLIGYPVPSEPTPIPRDFFEFRRNFLLEEIQELDEAYARGDFPEVIDALIDLVVVAMGTAECMGIDWQKHWDLVHQANMSKVRGKGKRNYGYDLIKPEGWVAPDHGELL